MGKDFGAPFTVWLCCTDNNKVHSERWSNIGSGSVPSQCLELTSERFRVVPRAAIDPLGPFRCFYTMMGCRQVYMVGLQPLYRGSNFLARVKKGAGVVGRRHEAYPRYYLSTGF